MLLVKKRLATITTHDISVTVSGRVDPALTSRCLRSLRRRLPGAEIVMATWDYCDVPDAWRPLYDRLLRLPDPGAEYYDAGRTKLCNVARILDAASRGVAAASRPRVLRMRSDMELRSSGFLDYADRFPLRDQSITVARRKIVTGSLFSLKFERDATVAMQWFGKSVTTI